MTASIVQGQDVPKDSLGGFEVTGDVLHHVVHAGKMFGAAFGIIDGSFDTAGVQTFAVTTGEKEVHATWQIDVVGGIVELIQYNYCTISSGTAVAAYNNYNAVTDTPGFSCKKNPTVGAYGAQAAPTRNIQGAATVQARSSSSLRKDIEIILPANQTTVFKLTAKADNITFDFAMSLYERFALL